MKNVLIIIPKSQFCEEELFRLRSVLKQKGINIVVLSKSGQEARGMKRDKFQPDGMIIDWDRHLGFRGKYHAIVLIGGKGARKSLWEDPIIPQILTDHYRAGSVIGAVGSALVVLVKTSLITGEIPLPSEEDARKELAFLNTVCIDAPVVIFGNIVLGQGKDSIDEFSETILKLIEADEIY